MSALDNPRSIANSRNSLEDFAFTRLKAPNARAGRVIKLKEKDFMILEVWLGWFGEGGSSETYSLWLYSQRYIGGLRLYPINN